MAFRKALVHRLLSMSKLPSPQTPISACSRSQTSTVPSLLQRLLKSPPPEEGNRRRFLHQNRYPVKPEHLSLPIGEKLIEKVKGLNRDRIRLDMLTHPIPPDRKVEDAAEGSVISVEEARKVLRFSQIEAVKARLRGISKASVSYSEYLQICSDGCSLEQGLGLARALDESGAVIVLGNVVAKAIQSVIPPLSGVQEQDPRREELREMEKRKAEIDGRADAQVRRELWCGLGFLVVQTAGFLRLTFWELSWDVMEPICFYVTSIYFMAGYAFFLRTYRDPSFEGFFESRFESKQKRLMRLANFDLKRFDELRKAIHPSSESPSASSASASYCDCCHKREGNIAWDCALAAARTRDE